MPQIPEYIRATSMVFCIIIMCLGVIGNIMVPIVILKTKDMRNSTNIFLTNLSIADLLVLLVCTPTVLVEVNSPPEVWVLGEEMCKAVPFVELTVAHASVLTILAISFERYYAICEPLKAGYVCTKTRALLICLAAWTVAAILTSPILMISSYDYVEYVNGNMVASCLTPVENFWHASFFVGSIVVFFIFPLFILVVLYSVIAKNLMDNPSIIMSNASGNRSNVLKYRKQVMFMLGAVVVSFFFCLLPFRALTLWIIIVPSESIVSIGFERFYIILYFCRIMLYMNSAINPILYNLMSSKFRNGFLQLLGCGKMIRSGSMSSTVRKGTFHTASTNLSSSQNSQRRLTRDESSVSGRTMESNNSRRRLLHQRHNSTISIKSAHEEVRDAALTRNGGSISIPSEVIPLNADKIEELDESTTAAALLPNGYGFHRFKLLNGSCSVINSSTSKTSQRLNGIVSVEPKTVHQPDNKYITVRAAVIVVKGLDVKAPGDDDPIVGLPSQEHAVVSSKGGEQIIITAKDENQNSNYVNQGQQHHITANGKDSVNVQTENKLTPQTGKTADGQESSEEVTKIRQFYGSMECDI